MAKTMPTLLDAIQDKECSKYVSMVVQDPREIFDAYTETMDELEQKVLVETSQGDIEFRNFNGTSKTTLPEYDVRRFECSVGNPILRMDWALYETAKSNGKVPDYIVRMKLGILKSVIASLGKQFYYGRTAKSKGPEGIYKLMDSGMVFDAGGSTANKQSSIVAVKWGPDATGICYGGGKDKMFNWSPIKDETFTDASGASRTNATCFMTMYPSVVVANPYGIGRIANVESINDAKIMKALALWADNYGFVPDCLYMRPIILETLRVSRTATNPTGSEAPMPDSVGGIPIHTTLSISKTEAVVANITTSIAS